MSDFEKFLFDTSFDSERVREAKARAAAEAEAAAEPPPPTFNEEELEAVRRNAFDEGRAAGLAEAEQAQGRRLAEMVAALPQHLQNLAVEIESQADARRRSTLEAAVTVVRKLFPHLARDSGLDEVCAVIDSCLERLRDEPRLVIRCADADLDALKERVEASVQRSGFEGKLVFLADETVASGDVRVEWADGGAERNQADLWKEIDAVIARALAPAAETPADVGDEHQKAAPQHAATPQSQPQQPTEVEPLLRAQSA